jgi:hypothetical protein
MGLNPDLVELIEKRIETFMGYGDPHSKIWLIGMEEGVSEKLKEGDYISIFANANCNFNDIDSSLWKIKQDESFWGWRFNKMWRLLSFLEGNKDAFEEGMDTENMKELRIFLGKKEKGSKYSNCLIEFNPVPFYINKTLLWFDYVLPRYGTRNKFLREINQRRVKLIKENIKCYSPKVVVFYGLTYKKFYLEFCENMVSQRISINESLSIYFFEINKTKVFIIPHCSDRKGGTSRKYKLIGEEILKH